MHKTMIYNNFRQDAPGLNEAEAWPKSVFRMQIIHFSGNAAV